MFPLISVSANHYSLSPFRPLLRGETHTHTLTLTGWSTEYKRVPDAVGRSGLRMDPGTASLDAETSFPDAGDAAAMRCSLPRDHT